MPANFSSSWNGLNVIQHKDRAAARALIAIGTNVAIETKTVTHRISGTLARSVHAAPVGYDGKDDERVAGDKPGEQNQDMMLMFAEIQPLKLGGEHIIEVGSWLPYACAEWVGRGHPGVTQGLELARERADAIMEKAFFEEGL